MKVEHFRAIHIRKFNRDYRNGRRLADKHNSDGKHLQRQWLILQDVKSFINEREFKYAAYWLGYADAMRDFSKLGSITSHGGSKGRYQAWAY